MKTAIALCFALTLGVAGQAMALSMSDMFEGSQTNSTAAGAYSGQTGNYYTGGSFYLRAPSRSYQLASMTPMSIDGGCNGIDLYTGGFSFISKDQFIQMLRNIGQNAAGYAFKLAIQNLCPSCDNIMSHLQQMSNAINRMNIDSCAAAKGIVNAVTPSTWKKEETETTKSYGVQQGVWEDFSAGYNGLVTDVQNFNQQAKNMSDDAKANGKEPNVPVGNIVWQALAKHDELSDEEKQMYMGLIGTYIFPEPGSSEQPTPVAPANIRVATLVGKQGDTTIEIPILKCMDNTDDDGCNKVQAADANGKEYTVSGAPFIKMVDDRITSILDHIAAHSEVYANPADQLKDIAFVNNTSLPVYKMLGTVSAIQLPGAAKGYVEKYEELIAVDYAHTYLSRILYEIELALNASSATQSAAKKQALDSIMNRMHYLREQIRAEQTEVFYKAQNVQAMVQEITMLERSLDASLPANLRSSLEWQRGQ